MINAYAAPSAGAPLEPFSYDPGPLGPDDVAVDVEHCGICHSDLSMIEDAWGMSTYPLVPGHEIVGTVSAVGEAVQRVAVGDKVGVGWFAGSCMRCEQCLGGQNNLCGQSVGMIVGHHGGFAEQVRCHWGWATPLPKDLDASSAGPLFCGGITVFSPFVTQGVRPTDRVGIIGVGGLGHLAVQFAAKWGCEVTAFTSNPDKAEFARTLGAHHVVSSRDGDALDAVAGSLDFILSTVNVSLDWGRLMSALKPNGRLHVVGAVLEPLPIAAFSLIGGQKSVSGSPLGSPQLTATMLEFCARHEIRPVVERFALADVNEALARLEAGNARYRLILDV